MLAAIPLTWWLIDQAAARARRSIILEHATIRQARRALVDAHARPLLAGARRVIIVISVIFGAVAQVVSLPLSFLSIGPDDDHRARPATPSRRRSSASSSAALLTQVLTLLIQSVAVVVQSTATALIYIDCRMRREGLDLDLLAYVERRDAGATALPDPYREHIGRVIAPRGVPAPRVSGPAYPPGTLPATRRTGNPSTAPPGHAPPAYGAARVRRSPRTAQPAYGAPPAPARSPPRRRRAASPPTSRRRPAPLRADAPAPPDAAAPPAPTAWAAPGAAPDGTDRESPWA